MGNNSESYEINRKLEQSIICNRDERHPSSFTRKRTINKNGVLPGRNIVDDSEK
jgi:hypothetical protein